MSLLAPNRRALANRFPEALALLETAVPVSAPPPPRAEESVAFFDEAAGYRRILLVLTGLPECATTAATLARAPCETIFWCLKPEPGPLAGAPLVLLAAGPSLDDALPFLRRVAPHALIVTGNTSFRALAAHGLAPHLTVTVDPFASTDLGYAGQPLEGSHLVAPVFAYPGVQQRFAGRLFGLADQSPLLARLRTAACLPPATALLGDATVSATILNLAVHFGCDRVVFVGQDFAIADDGRTHAADTFYTDLGCNQQGSENVHRLPSTTRPEVTVPAARHLWYQRTIEGHIARAPRIRFLNTSHRGAPIAGAPYADLLELPG